MMTDNIDPAKRQYKGFLDAGSKLIKQGGMKVVRGTGAVPPPIVPGERGDALHRRQDQADARVGERLRASRWTSAVDIREGVGWGFSPVRARGRERRRGVGETSEEEDPDAGLSTDSSGVSMRYHGSPRVPSSPVASPLTV